MEILQTETDIGIIRNQNEDSTLAISHPKNKQIKLLLVADGMGGKDLGEVASNYVKESLHKWFVSKSIKIINDFDISLPLISRYIKLLNTTLIKKYGKEKLGTTLTVALIVKNKTAFINVGDSRGYIYRKRKLIQITEDDSDVWYYHKYDKVKKDHLRFFPNNNLITSCIGLNQELCKITITVINNDYTELLLFTDGVTDMITDKKIEKIIKKSSKEKTLKNIIYEASYKNQHYIIPYSLKRKYVARFIKPFPGRDNASGAIFIKEY